MPRARVLRDPAAGPVAGAARGVVVVGDVMTDVIVKPEGPLARGSDRRATIRTLPGGSAANQAAWLGHFGVAVSLAAKVGQGDLDACAAILRGHGVTPQLRGDLATPTGTLVSLIDPDGQRSFLTDRGANDSLDADDLPDDLLDGAAILHVSGYSLFTPRPRAAVRDLMARARRRGLLVTVDPASTSFLEEAGPAAFLEWTRGADICFPNEEEAATLAGPGDSERQRRRLAQAYALVVIKRGARGAEAIGAGGARLARAEAPKVEAVDTTGAGDAFLAAYLAAHLAGAPLDERLARAVAAGSVATTRLGGRPPAIE